MSSKGLKISKENEDVLTTESKNMLVDSDFDTFKIYKSGTLTLNVPEETLQEEEKEYTATYNHNLGYKPFVLPYVAVNIGNPATYTLNVSTSPIQYEVLTPYVVNDVANFQILPGPFGFGPNFIFENIKVETTASQLKLVVGRTTYLLSGNQVKFTASQANLYYTIFYNQADTEFDLLS